MRALAVLLLALAGCGSSEDPLPTQAATGACAKESRAQLVTVGLSPAVPARKFQLKLVSATPSLLRIGENTWNIDLTDVSGAPVKGAVIEVQPFMPDHGHGSSLVPVVTADSSVPGRYQLGKLNLSMPGFWELRLSITASGVTDVATYAVCVDG